MGRLRRISARGLGMAFTTLVVLAPTAAAAGSITVPYNDLAAQGSISLCDAAGHAVTSGNIYDKPFVWRAISSQPPVAPYNGKGRTAVLLAYQPRSTAYPDQWNGDTLTGSTQYTDVRQPTAVATALDFSLADYLHEYPTRMGGWVQLRMYLGAPGTSTYTSSYPTADLLVSGNTWTLVRGGGVPCSTAPAVSNEVAVAKLDVSPTATAAQPDGGSTSQVRSTAGPMPSVAPGSASASGTQTQALAQAANPGQVSGGSGAGRGWLLALTIVTAGAVAIYALRRGRT